MPRAGARRRAKSIQPAFSEDAPGPMFCPTRAARRLFLTMILAAFAVWPGGARAQDRTVSIAVIGDSLADGLWSGLYRSFRSNRRVTLIRAAVNSSGFTAYNWYQEFQKLREEERVDAVVIAVGINDRQRMVGHGASRIMRFNTAPWHRLYEERLRAFMALLRDEGIPTVWVGLPRMRDESSSDDVRMLNAIYLRLSSEYRLAYAPLWDMTVEADGSYKAFFETEDGRRRRFRLDDGIHFTGRGYVVLAGRIIRTMRARYPDLLPPEQD
jgi:hypothetical protein